MDLLRLKINISEQKDVGSLSNIGLYNLKVHFGTNNKILILTKIHFRIVHKTKSRWKSYSNQWKMSIKKTVKCKRNLPVSREDWVSDLRKLALSVLLTSRVQSNIRYGVALVDWRENMVIWNKKIFQYKKIFQRIKWLRCWVVVKVKC